MVIRINNLQNTVESPPVILGDRAPLKCKNLHTLLRSPRPSHVLFIIDELCEMGGAERALFQIIRLLPSDLFRASLITFRIDPKAELIQHAPCPLHVLPLTKTYDWNGLRVAGQIFRFIRQEQVEIVHTFFETSDLWAGPIAKLSGCPILISSRRDLGIQRTLKHRVGYKLLRRLYDSVLAVSPQVRDFCVRQDGLEPTRVQTVFNGLDLDSLSKSADRESMRREMSIPEGAPVITTVGNIRYVKGIDVLAKVAVLVCRKYPQAIFLVAGRKSDERHCGEVEQSIRASGLSGNFRFLGSREDVYSILRMSDVFCLPSRSEGFSNALLEAMACALPCVATNVGGNEEALQDGQTGFLVPSEDHQSMAERLIQLLDNPPLATRMGLRGQAIIQTRFTSEVMIQNLVRVYQEQLAAKECN